MAKTYKKLVFFKFILRCLYTIHIYTYPFPIQPTLLNNEGFNIDIQNQIYL